MSLVAVRVRELAEGGEDGGRVLLGDARGLRRVSGGGNLLVILVFQNTMPACQNSHIGLPALRKFRSRGG